MKNKLKAGFWIMIICGLAGFISCEDMLKVNPGNLLNTADNKLNSPNDTMYSVIGIVKQLQDLGPKYIIAGELRGDLMAVTDNADMNLQAIANFNATKDNPYVSTREYYSIINNCNYFLQHVDTNMISGGRKVMKGEYSIVKAIRAWTYLQLVLNYGKAVYFTQPILTTDDMNKDLPVMQPQELIQTLISEGLDFTDYLNYPNYGSSQNTSLFISGPMVAGDLLLWMGAYTGNTAYYEQAAALYYQYITYNYLTGGSLRNIYANSNFNSIDSWYWRNIMVTESFSYINYSINSSEVSTYPQIMLLTWPKITGYSYEYMLKPSQASIDLWNNEVYTYYNTTTKKLYYTTGDLRGYCMPSTFTVAGSYYYDTSSGVDSLPAIAKYGNIVTSGNSYSSSYTSPYIISIYRTGKVFLRYAEALNALGKPSVAFAVLKYGLRREVLSDTTKVNPEEITPMPPYCDFTNPNYSTLGSYAQTGVHLRGAGDADRDTTYYMFKDETLQVNRDRSGNFLYYGLPNDLATKQDSIDFVDVMICKELGLETAFEGNRFQDLMWFSIRKNDNSFLAKWVGRRNPALTATLMNSDNWYLPTPE